MEAADDPVVERLPPDVFAEVPELALRVLEPLDRVRPLVFDAFSEPVFGGIGGWTGCVRDVDCALPSCCFVAPRLPVAV